MVQLRKFVCVEVTNNTPVITFDTKEDYILEDRRVMLRPLLVSDVQELLPFSLQEPDIWKYSLTGAQGEEQLKSYVQSACEARQASKEYPFIVWDHWNKKFAGSTRFYDIQPTQGNLQLGYTWYGKLFQGTGLNKHCKYLLLSFAFDQLGFERVEFRADASNERSIRAMKSIGCTVEGILRSQGYRSDGSRRDSIVLSILRNEWDEHVREHLKRQCQ